MEQARRKIKKHASKKRSPDSIARWLAAGLFVLILLTIYASTTARLIRPSSPIAGLLTVRFHGQGRVIAPAIYLAVFSPIRHTLDLVHIPPSTPITPIENSRRSQTLADVYGDAYLPEGNIEQATRAVGDAAWNLLSQTLSDIAPGESSAFWFNFNIPKGDARPAFPEELKARILDTAAAPLYWLHAFTLLQQAHRSEWTELSLFDLLVAARELRSISPQHIQLHQLPEPALWARFGDYLAALTKGEALNPGRTTLEVLNATEISGVALQATKILRLRGFDVVHFGNTRTLEERLRILDRTGNGRNVRSILHALECSDGEVLTEMTTEPRASITLILGRKSERCKKLQKH